MNPSLLHPYQVDAVRWAWRVKRGILADDIGLGKTVTAIALADEVIRRATPNSSVLVVAPKSLLSQWRSEVERFSEYPSSYHYLNYEALKKLDFYPCCLICDEATYIKSASAQRSIRTVALARQVPYVLFLTATPVRNNEADLFTMLYTMEPFLQSSHTGDLQTDLHRSYADFVSSYFRTFHMEVGGRVITRIGAMNVHGRKVLNDLLGKWVMRRTKSLLNLPTFSRDFIAVDMLSKQRQAYDEVLSGLLRTEGEVPKDIPNFLAQMTRLRQAALDPALYGGVASSAKTDWLKENLKYLSRPTLIFTNYAQYAKRLQDALPGSVMLTGDMSAEMRQASVDVFMEGKSDVFILSATAGGFGLNLQRASLVIWTDMPWTPDIWMQGNGRAYRQGQTSEVHEVVLGCVDSVDGKIVRLLQKKNRIANEVGNMIAVWQELRAEKRSCEGR
ncbi:MAG: DEAD/DEAH box helicase [Nitrososphaerota archaeon]|nr:DEAD/DEAH box helicase [Nitrososphaerota archaeon]